MSKRKGAAADNLNKDFCDFLIELAEYEKNVSRNIHKHNAYKKASSVLAALDYRITSGEQAQKLNGIGPKIAKKIDEFLETGKLQKLENIHKDEGSNAISLLTRVTGIGPAKASELVSMGIKTIEDLEKNRDKLTHHQKIGLRYFEDFEKPIPREEIEELETKLTKIIKAVDTEFTITVCGSYRRGKATSGDIDVLLTHPSYTGKTFVIRQKTNLKHLVSVLEKDGLVTDVLSLGETKFMGVCKKDSAGTARRIDIRLIPCDQYYCAILYFTGSDVFNKAMRAHALQKGFTLNEYSLRPVGVTGVPGEPVEINSERDIFDYIDYPYRDPEKRTN